MTYTTREQAYLEQIQAQVMELKRFLNDCEVPDNIVDWFDYIAHIRRIQGNISNSQSFLATVLAKQYLAERFELGGFDAAEKPQGAPGLDIDLMTRGGERIVGEIKTTVPYKEHDLGAQQKATFRKDFTKLNKADAAHKFFFVTDRRTEQIVKQRYASQIPDVEIVLLIVD